MTFPQDDLDQNKAEQNRVEVTKEFEDSHDRSIYQDTDQNSHEASTQVAIFSLNMFLARF